MAKADYYLCDLCGEKAFYDACLTDDRYPGWSDPGEPCCDMQVLCIDCSKTHEVVIIERTNPASENEND